MSPIWAIPAHSPWQTVAVLWRFWWLAKVRQERRGGYQRPGGHVVWTYRQSRVVWRVLR